jgi:transcriptional regulator with XRE-family HTH domain
MAMDSDGKVGSRLRAIREERGLSQRELAHRAEISTNAISLIERDESSPSVATLQNLATALGVKMSYFFEEHRPTQVLHVRAAERPVISSKGVHIEGLHGRLDFQEMEPFVVQLKPKMGSGERQVVHAGHELVYCLAGSVEYLIDGKKYALMAGDILLFEAQLPHLWRNVTAKEARILLILQATGQTTQSVERHFSDYPSLRHLGK